MASRIHHHGYTIFRYSGLIARYTMLTHKKETPNPDRYESFALLKCNHISLDNNNFRFVSRYRKLYRGKFRFRSDGLNNLKYKRVDLVFRRLYTWVLVDLLPPRTY